MGSGGVIWDPKTKDELFERIQEDLPQVLRLENLCAETVNGELRPTSRRRCARAAWKAPPERDLISWEIIGNSTYKLISVTVVTR